MSAKLVPTFADRGCRVVSATDLALVRNWILTPRSSSLYPSSYNDWAIPVLPSLEYTVLINWEDERHPAPFSFNLWHTVVFNIGHTLHLGQFTGTRHCSSVDRQQTMYHTPEDHDPNIHCCETLRSHKVIYSFYEHIIIIIIMTP
jgi:hypothetical protein